MRLSCRLGYHLPIFWSKGDYFYHYYKTFRYDKVKCSICNKQLAKPKKQLKLEKEIDAEILVIRAEIKKYGHPLITGITGL